MAYSEEFRDGAAMNSEWCRVSLELLADLYANVCQLYPTYQEEKIEKIMWKFYIGLVIINIVLIREEIEGGRGKFIEGVVGIIKNGIKQDGFGLGKSIISTAYELFKLTIQGDEKFMPTYKS